MLARANDSGEVALDLLPPCPVLREIIARRTVMLPGGEEKRLTSEIGPAHARALYETVLSEKPDLVVEIGMAQGVSTLSILCALKQTGGSLISIDPYVNWKSGKAAALHAVERAGYAQLHRHIEAKSYDALPHLLREGVVANLGYIDGNHDFDHVFIDFFYLDRMLAARGVLGFNDTRLADVHGVLRFLQTRRQYAEIDVGLETTYRGGNPVITVVRRLLNRQCQDRYFRKLTDSEDNA